MATIPVEIDVTLTRGLTWPGLILNCVDPVTGNPVNLTGDSVFAEVRRLPGSDIIASLNPSVTNAVGGVVTVPAMTISQTALLLKGNFLWDFTISTDVNNRFGPFAVGKFTVQDIITRGSPPQPTP